LRSYRGEFLEKVGDRVCVDLTFVPNLTSYTFFSGHSEIRPTHIQPHPRDFNKSRPQESSAIAMSSHPPVSVPLMQIPASPHSSLTPRAEQRSFSGDIQTPHRNFNRFQDPPELALSIHPPVSMPLPVFPHSSMTPRAENFIDNEYTDHSR